MKANVVEMDCKHMQNEGQQTYAVLAVTDERGTWMLRLPMWQYYGDDGSETGTRELLEKIAGAINSIIDEVKS